MSNEFNKDQILKAYSFNLHYAKDLVSDLSDDQLYKSPGDGLENSPGFTLGHLVVASAMIAEDLGDEYKVPEGWNDFFMRRGPGDPRKPLPYTPEMPNKEALVNELVHQHDKVVKFLKEATQEKLNELCSWRFGKFFPTVGDMVTFMCITHEAMHLAQVAAWRRAYGLESSLGRIK